MGWGVHTFSKGISPKVNVIPSVKFELDYYNVAVKHVSLYTTGISSRFFIQQMERFGDTKVNHKDEKKLQLIIALLISIA